MPQQFDKLRLAIKKQLKDENPNLSDKELDDRSWAIATAQWKKSHNGQSPGKEDYKLDENGEIIIGENVKIILEANITPAGDMVEE